jgi:hypothetical protein
MGLTAFNRQRRIALQKKVGDQTIADKLYANGYTHFSMLADASAEDLSFLSEKQLQKLNKTGSTEPTVQENKDALPGLTIEELNEALELESNGKNRKTAIKAIEARIEELEQVDPEPDDEDESEAEEETDTEPDDEPEAEQTDETEQQQEEPQGISGENTVSEIKAYLDEQGIEYTSRMKKDELLELAGG